MQKIVIVCFIIFTSLASSAQTKKIAHRSHSGKDNTLILNTSDNFGNPYPIKKDTVIVKKDTATTKALAKRNLKKKKKYRTAVKH